MICPNPKSKDYNKYEQLKLAVNEYNALHILNENKGNPIDETAEGERSFLFDSLVSFFNGNVMSAIKAKAHIYTFSFKNARGKLKMPLRGNEELYNQFKLLNNKGEIKSFKSEATAKKYAKSFKNVDGFNVVYGKTPKGYSVFLQEKDNQGEPSPTMLLQYLGLNRMQKLDKDDATTKSTKSDLTAIGGIAEQLSKKFGVEYKFISEDRAVDIIGREGKSVKGFVRDNVVYLVDGKITNDTPFHEFGHIFISAIKNDGSKSSKQLYNGLIKELKNTDLGKETIKKIERLYPELSEEDMLEEALVESIGLIANSFYQQNKNKTLWQKIKDLFSWINSKFKKESTTLRDISPTSTMQDIAKMMLVSNPLDVKKATVVRSLQKEKSLIEDIVDQSKGFSIAKDEEGNEMDYYQGPKGERRMRVGQMTNNFTYREVDKDKSIGERAAETLWNGYEDTDKRRDKVTGNLLTKDEYIATVNERGEKAMARGTVVTRKVEKVIVGIDGTISEEQRAKKIHEIDVDVNTASAKLDVFSTFYNWVEEGIETIFENANINVFQEAPEDVKDKVKAEVVVENEILNMAGSLDVLVEHSNGALSITDWKSGNSFDERFMNSILKFGNQENRIYDNYRDRAKLQVMLYALMIKANNPNVKFRHLQVINLPNRIDGLTIDRRKDVDVASYLKMIEQFLKDEDSMIEAGYTKEEAQTIHKKLVKASPRIFNPVEYNELSSTLADDLLGKAVSEAEQEHISIEHKIALAKAELRQIASREQRDEKLSHADEVRRSKLSSLILELETDSDVTLNYDEEGRISGNPETDELSTTTRWLGGWSDMKHPLVKLLRKEKDKATQKTTDSFNEFEKEFNYYVENLKNDYKRFNIKLFGARIVDFIDYREMYGPLLVREEVDDIVRERMITKEKDADAYNDLTKSQREFVDFFNKTMKSYFGKNGYYSEKNNTDQKGNPMTVLEHNESVKRNAGERFEYYEGFFPKVHKTMDEYRAERGGAILGRFNKETLQEHYHRATTWYIEDNYEEYKGHKLFMPIKYLGSRKIENSKEYSVNLENALKKFVKATEYKRNMGDVFNIAKGVEATLELTNKGMGAKDYSNTIAFLKDQVVRDILNERRDSKLTRTSHNIGDKPVSTDKVIKTAMSWVSMSTMWLKPIQGFGNGLHAILLTYRDAIKGSIAQSKFLGINGNEVDFTLKDRLFAAAEFRKYVKDATLGNIRNNKIWLLAKKFRYLPDNLDYDLDRNSLLTKRNPLMNSGSLYFFHSMWEEYVSFTTMVAQLKHMKVADVNGETKSAYDRYNVKYTDNGVAYVEWDGTVRHKKKVGRGENARFESLTELDANEISRLRKVHERMQGGYRKDEASAMETYVLGKMFIQLKKYFPRLVINAYGSKLSVEELGRYELVEMENGEKYYEWIARRNEGRFRSVVNLIVNLPRIKKEWSSYSAEQKQNVVDAAITLIIWAGSYAAYLQMFDDEDEDDTAKKFWKMYLIDNLTQQYNWVDQLRTVKSMTPVSIVKTFGAVESIGKMLTAGYDISTGNKSEAFTQEGNLQGWVQFRKSIPGVAAYYDFASKVEDNKSLDWLNEGVRLK